MCQFDAMLPQYVSYCQLPHQSTPASARVCEYDDSDLEYWVNVRTSGTLSREDLQRLSHSQTHEGEVEDITLPDFNDETGGFGDLGQSGPPELSTEGDSGLQVTG